MQVCTVVFGKTRLDRLGEALQAVDHGDQDVAAAAGLELVQHLEPELGAFGLLDPQPQHVLVPSAWMPSARYTALLRHHASSRILTRSASKNTTGYIGSSGRFCQALTSAMHLVGHLS